MAKADMWGEVASNPKPQEVEPEKTPEPKAVKPTEDAAEKPKGKAKKAGPIVFVFDAAASPKFTVRVSDGNGKYRSIYREISNHVLRLDAGNEDDTVVANYVRKNAAVLRAKELKDLSEEVGVDASIGKRIDRLLALGQPALVQMLSDASDRAKMANASVGELISKLLDLEGEK